MAQVESLNCMKDITIVHVGKRNFRVPTASLPSKYSSCKDIYVDKESDSSNIKAGSTKEEEITLELKIPRYLYGYIIGRGGSTVKQLREETKTKINLPYHKGPVTITGTKDKAEIAKKRIEDIIAPYNNNTGNEKSINDTKIEDKNKDNVEDYETIVLNIFWRLHRIIIGSRGSTIIQIQEETKTRITSLSYDNLIVISGTKDGVEMAKKRIENIIESYNKTENEKSNDTKIEDKMKDDVESFKESIKDIEVIILKIPGRLHGSIIGWGGSIVRQIKDETKTGINALSDDNLVVISGVKDGVEMAKKRIEDIIESQNKPESEKSNDTKIEDKKKDDVESINESIKDNEEITFKFNVPRRSLGLIIGRGGSTVRKIKDETNTKITALSDESLVIISGSKDGVEMAKKQIEDIIESYNNAGNEKSFNNNTGIEDNKNENIGLIRESIREKKEVNERYVTESLDIPQPLHGLIIGRGGSIIKQINYETRTRITLLPDDNLATISGTKGGIERAKKRIKEIIESDSIFKLPPTHFISLPLTDPHIQRKVEDFKSNVLELNLQGVDKSILINSHSLHITIGMLHLYRKQDIEGAVKLLKDLSKKLNELIGKRTLVSMLSGIAVMEEKDPVKSHVLYARVEEPAGQNTIEKLGEFLIDKFAEAGYLRRENRPLKLHVTLINTRHRDEHSASSNNNNKQEESNRYPFNAVSILNKFSNIEFGPNRLESIHISKIAEYDENGRHRSEGGIKLS